MTSRSIRRINVRVVSRGEHILQVEMRSAKRTFDLVSSWTEPDANARTLKHAFNLGQMISWEELRTSPAVIRIEVVDLEQDGDDSSPASLKIRRMVVDAFDEWSSSSLEPPSRPQIPPAASRMTRFASLAAVEPASEEEWRTELQELAAEGSHREVICYALGILYAGLHSRVAWLARRACRPGVSILQWVLRSEIRTWTPFVLLTWWAATETAEDTGIGAAILLVIVSFSALAITVNWLRDRFDAHPRKRQKAADK